jgi:subtilisin family serine protease
VTKIGPDLAHRIAAEQQKPGAAASVPSVKLWVYVTYHGDVEAIRRAGFDLVAPLGGSARAHLTIAEIERLAQRDDVTSIDLPSRVEPMLDRSVPEIRAPLAWGVPPLNAANTAKGGGIVCGIIDSGFDVFHASLRHPDGRTRIRYYWDQTFLYDPVSGNPTDSNGVVLTGDDVPLDETDNVATQLRAPTVPGCNWGIEFTDEQIDAALARHPDGKDLPISLRDDGSRHGTHVAGTTAGDGSVRDRCTPPFTYQGVAPEADLIVVKMGFDRGRFQDSMAAMDYVFAMAQRVGDPPATRPCAINMSFGGHSGPHNGFSTDSGRIDAALAGTTGRAVIIAGSNDREGNFHAAELVAAGTTTTINLVVEAGVERVLLFGSYDSLSSLTYRARLPSLPPPALVRQSQVFDPLTAAVQPAHGHRFEAFVRASRPGDPDRHFAFEIRRPPPAVPPPPPAPPPVPIEAGSWQIDLICAGAIGANVHLWQASPSARFGGFRPFGFQPVAAVANPSPQDNARPAAWRRPESWISGTLSQGSTTRSAITVAAYDAETVNTPIGSFSSQGPALLNLSQGLYPTTPPDKPDIAAPGVAINAAKAAVRKPFLCCECCMTHHMPMQGTSMAAPHVTGVAALMLAQDPLLNADDVKRIMKENARAAPALPAGFPDRALLFGAGNIDAFMCAFRARESAEARAGGGGGAPVPDPFVITSWPVRDPWQDFEDRLRAWERLFGKRPAWQLCAYLVSTHFDEVKRLIDTNRRVAAVWQRHGGPQLVRRIVLGNEHPDPPLPETIEDKPVLVLIDRLVAILTRYGSASLKADTDRYCDFVRRLPGMRIADIDEALPGGAAA